MKEKEEEKPIEGEMEGKALVPEENMDKNDGIQENKGDGDKDDDDDEDKPTFGGGQTTIP